MTDVATLWKNLTSRTAYATLQKAWNTTSAVQMYSQQSTPPQPPLSLSSTLHKVIAVCSVAVIAYFAAELGGAMVLRPQMVWPLWPGCAFLVSVLWLTSRKIWPALLVAGLAG